MHDNYWDEKIADQFGELAKELEELQEEAESEKVRETLPRVAFELRGAEKAYRDPISEEDVENLIKTMGRVARAGK